ncbi:hypothetical protein N9242_03340 [Vicingaceae bacterium]|nr:hypothetical protein [Vicingaceae bacterium]
MTKNEQIETSTAEYYIDADIFFIRAKQDADFTLEAVIEGVDVRKKMQQGKIFPVLMDTRLMFQSAKEANEYGASKDVSELSSAMAILVGTSMSARIIGNFFIKFNKPFVPTKLFNSEEKAIEWLNSFK